MCVCVYIHTYLLAYIYTHLLTYIHTYIHMKRCVCERLYLWILFKGLGFSGLFKVFGSMYALSCMILHSSVM